MAAAASLAFPAAVAASRVATVAEQADTLGRLFVSVTGVVVAYGRGRFAFECWRLKDLCRETRYIAGVTQPGSIADMVFHGCRLSGLSMLLEEARTCRRNGNYRTQLMRAARYNDFERVRQLLGLGCPIAVIDAQNEGGWTALLWATEFGNEAIVHELVAHGADVNIQDHGGWSPPLRASVNGKLAIMRLLCNAPGIDLNVRGGCPNFTVPPPVQQKSRGRGLPALSRRAQVRVSFGI